MDSTGHGRIQEGSGHSTVFHPNGIILVFGGHNVEGRSTLVHFAETKSQHERPENHAVLAAPGSSGIFAALLAQSRGGRAGD